MGLKQIAQGNCLDQVGISAGVLPAGLVNGLHGTGIARTQRPAESVLRELPRDTLAHAIAGGEVVHQFAGRTISNRLSFAGKQDLPVLAQAIAVVVLFEIRAEPVEAFEAEGERFELAVATPAVGVGDAFLGNAALAEAG